MDAAVGAKDLTLPPAKAQTLCRVVPAMARDRVSCQVLFLAEEANPRVACFPAFKAAGYGASMCRHKTTRASE